MIRKFVFAMAIVMIFVVASGYVPGFITHRMGEEKEVLGLFKISWLDDITHGLTAVLAVVAAAHSRKASLLFLTAFGWYYALDAIFFLLYGFVNEKPYTQDIMLNLPHVIIGWLWLWFVYSYAPKEEGRAPEPDGLPRRDPVGAA